MEGIEKIKARENKGFGKGTVSKWG